MTEVFANNATLTALPPYGTTMPVPGTVEGWGVSPLSAAWPALSAGQTMSIVDPSMPSEIIRITASAGPGAVSITVTRGADGTVPVSHQADAVFKASLVASVLDSFGQGGTFVPSVKLYGAKGDGIQLFDAVITSGTNTLTSASAIFTQLDVGKVIWIYNANTGPSPLCTTIAAVTGLGAATLAVNANHSVSGVEFCYGTDDTTALQTAVNTATATAKGGTLYSPAGWYMLTTGISVPNTQGTNGALRLIGDGYAFAQSSGSVAGPISGTVWKAANNSMGEVLLLGTVRTTGLASFVENMAFDASFSASNTVIINTYSGVYFRVGTFRSNGHSLYLANGGNTFVTCDFANNGGGDAFFIDGVTNTASNNDIFITGGTFQSANYGLRQVGTTADLSVTGAHFFPSGTGNDIALNGSAVKNINLNNNTFEDVVGNYISLAPAASGFIVNVNINDNNVFAFGLAGFTDNTFSFVSIDTSASSSAVASVNVNSNTGLGQSGILRWKSIINFVTGTGWANISVSGNNFRDTVAAWTGATPDGATGGNIYENNTVGNVGPTGDMNYPVTVASNAGTVPVTHRLQTFTNSSAATMAITLAVASAFDGQKLTLRIYDFSAAAQTIGWTNTENSTASVPTTSNGSITLPKTVDFQFNGATSKWRCTGSV